MAKTKKKNSSDNASNRKLLNGTKKFNPFEVHVNRDKMKVLGRKLKNDRGLPGVSRAKALKKRKETLQEEYKVQSKSNKFTDRRIGEQNKTMGDEDRVIARFTAERLKKHNKKNIFNLADDEILTHKGQTLSEIEKFDDPRSDDEESIEGDKKTGRLESKFVADAHFGGGLLKKTGLEGAKSHKDLIDQLIAESKKRKAEKQKIKEQTLELTEKLDSEWKDLLPLVNKTDKKHVVDTQVDDYDKVMKELKFEARGTPSDRLKTEDEIAKEEREKLEKLEADRLQRMQGFTQKEVISKKHKSADDLDDDFEFDLDPDITLSYNQEGQANVELEAELNGQIIKYQEKTEDDHEEQDDESVEEEEEDEESDDEDNLSDLKVETSESEDDFENSSHEELNVEDQEVAAKKEEVDKRNKTVCRENTDKEINRDNNTVDKKKKEVIKEKKEVNKEKKEVNNRSKTVDRDNEEVIRDNEITVENNSNIEEMQEKIKADLKQRKLIMDAARNEVPYTFKLPETYEELQSTLVQYGSLHQSIVVERMIKCNHPSMSEANKEKLGLLFAYLLQYINDISTELTTKSSVKKCIETFSNLVPLMFDLAQLNKESAQKCMLEVVKEKQRDLRKRPKSFPDLDVLLYLKLISCLFPTSDFRHCVVTPAVIFVEQMLNKCRVKSKRDVAYGLFLVALILEFTTLSKRFSPTAINYLAGILHMCVPKRSVQILKVLPPFKPNSNLLVVEDQYDGDIDNLKLNFNDLLHGKTDDAFKIRVLYTAVKMAKEFNDNFFNLPSNCEIFASIQKYLNLIPLDYYPAFVCEEIESFSGTLDENELNRNLQYLVMPKAKPKALRLYEPNVEKVFDTKKHKVQSREKTERDKLLHKIKREKKGALREIRRDQAFLGRLKIKDRIRSDTERRDKVKRIYAEASVQQSELNSLSRQNKKIKR